MNTAELRVLISLLLKLGMQIAEITSLLRQRDVTPEQISDADIQNEVTIFEKIAELKALRG